MIKWISSTAMMLAVFAGAVCAAGTAEAHTGKAIGHHRAQQGDANSGYTASISCLTPAAKNLWYRISSRFPNVYAVSTCRPGARVAGTGGISRHSSGNAIDFMAPGNKSAVVNWLIDTHSDGGTMTYANSDHIHADIGPRWVSLAGERRRHVAEAPAARPHRHRTAQAFAATPHKHRHHKRSAPAVDPAADTTVDPAVDPAA